jgi:serine/threonine protein kinase
MTRGSSSDSSGRPDHPNIVPIYSVEQVGDFHYFVMKYVAGQSLDDVLAAGPLPPETTRRVLAQAAAGLGHAHERGVIHRDIKPSNIMIDEAGRVLIADFGISKALQEGTQYTSTGQIVGTASYLSPEQAQGLPLDGRSDLYSLAVVGYQMVVGQLPLVADNVHALLFKHIYESPRSALEARPEIPADLSEVLQRALAKKPTERFQSMEEFAAAVCPDYHAPGAWPGVLLPARRKRRRILAVSAAVAALLAAAAAFAVWQGTRMTPAEVADTTISPATEDSIVMAQPVETLATSDTGRSEPAAPSVTDSRPPPVPPPTARRRPAPPKPAQPEAVSPSPPRVGYLTVNAVPYGSVSIDGVEVGDTPIVKGELAPGQHTVRITRAGYRTETAIVTITVGNEVRLSKTLVQKP